MFNFNHYLSSGRIEALVDSAVRLFWVLFNYAVMRWVFLRVIKVFSDRVTNSAIAEDRRARVKTLSKLIANVVNYLIIALMLLTALKSIGVDIAPLLATAGVAGLAIGFGAQKLVKDIIGGFFLLAEDQYNVGDIVSIGAQTGRVIQLGMRTTVLKDNDGRIIFIPNGDVSVVVNHSRLDGVRSKVSVKCKPSVDPQSVISLMSGHATDLGYININCGVSAFDSTGITIEVNGMVPPHQVDQKERELREALWLNMKDQADMLA